MHQIERENPASNILSRRLWYLGGIMLDFNLTWQALIEERKLEIVLMFDTYYENFHEWLSAIIIVDYTSATTNERIVFTFPDATRPLTYIQIVPVTSFTQSIYNHNVNIKEFEHLPIDSKEKEYLRKLFSLFSKKMKA
jgi:hypothetical protein